MLKGPLLQMLLLSAGCSPYSYADLDERCGAQARQEFNSKNWKEQYPLLTHVDYKNHYNRHLGKCIIVVSTLERQASAVFIMDVFEHTQMGSSTDIPNPDANTYHQICSISSVLDHATCTADKFDSFVKKALTE